VGLTGRRIGGLVVVALLAATVIAILWILLMLLTPSPARPLPGGIGAPLTMDQFKVGLGCVESDGDYQARNDRTDAIGKYQILPVNWRVWSGRFLGDRRAEPTPENQEIVSTRRLTELWRAFDGNWARMAYWWLTGREETDRALWSDFANSYVNSILGIASASQTMAGRATIALSCFSTPEDPFPDAPPTLLLPTRAVAPPPATLEPATVRPAPSTPP
jgi:hypothetical protein